MRELEKKIRRLEKELSPLYDERNKIRNKEYEKQCKRMVGKCFKTKNWIVRDKKWELYVKVVGYNKYGLILLEFENPKEGERMHFVRTSGIPYDYKEITQKQFEKFALKILKKIGGLVNGENP